LRVLSSLIYSRYNDNIEPTKSGESNFRRMFQ
jgi:hypothetical protein